MVEDITIEHVELDLLEDKAAFEEELKSNGQFFKLEENVTYKIKLTSTKVKTVEKTFEGEDGEPVAVKKYVLNITAKGSDGTEFEGTWEVGRSILTPIFKNYAADAVFNVSRSGKGKNTKYSVNLDF